MRSSHAREHGGSSIRSSGRVRSGSSRETGKPIAQVARDLGINEGTLGNWVAQDRAEREGTTGLSTGRRG